MAAAVACSLPAPASVASPERALLELFSDRSRVVRLGQAYLAGLDAPPSPADLARLVWDGLPASGGLRRRVATRVRDDFAAERVVSLHGWLLSVTEARICGLLALTERHVA